MAFFHSFELLQGLMLSVEDIPWRMQSHNHPLDFQKLVEARGASFTAFML